MNDATLKIIEATLKSDPSITPAARGKFLKLAKNGESEPVQNNNGHEPKIYSRTEAAKLVGDKSPRYIDQLAARGLLQKFVPPGNQRAIGITGESLRAFIGT